MGAWIETAWFKAQKDSNESHPTWVRGLKRFLLVNVAPPVLSHPTWVRGLKHA